MNRRHAILVATTVTATIAAAPAAAQTGPDAESAASAVEVDGILTISGTEASTVDDGSASATVLELGGETVVGGSQDGVGEQRGEILTTGEDNEQGYLTVGAHEAVVEDERSAARTSVVDGNLGGEGGATVNVLESRSGATTGGSEAETTGVRVQLSDAITLELLHAHTSSTGEGGSYVVGVNDERLLTSEQAGGGCEIPADPLLHLLCLYASAIDGDDGTTGGGAGVADLTALDSNLTGRVFDTTAGGVGPDGGPAGDDGDDAPAPAGDAGPLPAPDDVAAPGELPRTGAGLLPGLAGLLAMGAGEALRRAGRR